LKIEDKVKQEEKEICEGRSKKRRRNGHKKDKWRSNMKPR